MNQKVNKHYNAIKNNCTKIRRILERSEHYNYVYILINANNESIIIVNKGNFLNCY